MSLPNDLSEIPDLPTDQETFGRIFQTIRAMLSLCENSKLPPEVGVSLLAEETIKILSEYAANGSRIAQQQFYTIAKETSRLSLWMIERKMSHYLELVREDTEVPGFMSRSQTINTRIQKILTESKQGDDNPYVSKPGKVADRTAQGWALVTQLYEHIESKKQFFKLSPRNIITDSLWLKIEALPNLTSKTWRQWHDVGLLILDRATGGKILEHPSFLPGGVYESLGRKQAYGDARKYGHQGKSDMKRELQKGWQQQAKYIESIP